MARDFTVKGRLVEGDPYKTYQKKDDKTGQPRFKADGSPMMSSYVALAVPKNDPTWAALKAGFDADAAAAWPQGQYRGSDFANKIEDGDSTVTTAKRMTPNCAREGWAGHWVIKFSSGFAPKVVYWDAARGWTESTGGHCKIGDYVTIIGNIESNGSTQSPGMYMNVNTIAFEQEGPAIRTASGGPDLNAMLGSRGPGGAAVPNGASPAAAPQSAPSAPAAMASPSSAPPPPHTAFMTAPPPPPPAGPVMTAAANGLSYDSYIASGWTDDLLRQHGMMV